MKLDTKHEFALYWPELNTKNPQQLLQSPALEIEDEELFKRIVFVLRLKSGDTLIVFCQRFHCRISLESVQKKTVTIIIHEVQDNTPLTPSLGIIAPFLKREALAELVYGAVEIGANNVHLVETKKGIQLKNFSLQKELTRLERIAYSAAEQSKNFCGINLEFSGRLNNELLNVLASKYTKIIFCDANGTDTQTVLKNLGSTPQSIALIIGPEGDLTHEEKQLLTEYSIPFWYLTPTILRAPQAAILAAGIIRALTYTSTRST